MTEQGRSTQRLARQVRRRREALGMTLEDLSDVCGLTPVFLERIESALCDVSLADIAALALALDCEAADLFLETDDVMTDVMPEELQLSDAVAPPAGGKEN